MKVIQVCGVILLIFCFCYPGCTEICKDPDLCYQAGKEDLVEGNYSDAALQISIFLSIHPDNASALNNLGVTYLRMDNCSYAEKLFSLASRDSSIANQALQNMGLALLCQGRVDAAEDIFSTLITQNRSDSFSWYQRGMISYQKDDLRKSEEDLREAVRLNPNNIEIQRTYATVLAALGKYDEGLLILERISNVSPSDDLVLYNKGIILEKKGEFKRAVDAYNSVIKIRPDNYKAWFNKGIILWNHYMLNESLSSLNTVINLEPNMSEAWYFRGLILIQMNQYEEAKKSFQNASRLSPDNEIYSAYLKKYSQISLNETNHDDQSLPFQYRVWQIILPIVVVLGSWVLGLRIMRKKIR